MTISNFHTIDLEEVSELLEQQDYKSLKVVKFIEQLWEASSKTGFFYITNHGVDQEQINNMFSFRIFSESLEVKRQYYDTESSGSVGYSQIGNEKLSETLPDQKEILNFRVNKLNIVKHPTAYEKNLEYVKAFLQKTWKSDRVIFICLALSLGLEANYFYEAHNKELQSGGYYRLLHYPPIENDKKNYIRAGRHSDYGSLTLLFHETSSYEKLQSSSGLQVLIEEKNYQGSEVWEDVPAKKNCIIVNIGDLLAFWTEGRLKSPIHRVIVPEGEVAKKSRYIMTHFIHPNEECQIHPIKSSIPAPFPAKEITPGAYKASFGTREFFYGDTTDTYIQRRFSKTF